MASLASSVKGVPNRFLYGTSKAAVIGMTKAMAADYLTKGIRVNAICPGTVDTPSLHDRMRATGDYEAAHKAFIARQPMGRWVCRRKLQRWWSISPVTKAASSPARPSISMAAGPSSLLRCTHWQ